ncbi:MAG: hypothetical protein ABIH34_05935 [Nanoarchaeota archaeon]
MYPYGRDYHKLFITVGIIVTVLLLTLTVILSWNTFRATQAGMAWFPKLNPTFSSALSDKTSDIVSAHRCDADDTCEAGELTADNVIVHGDIISEELAGRGSAYACLSSTGELYRSETPCT